MAENQKIEPTNISEGYEKENKDVINPDIVDNSMGKKQITAIMEHLKMSIERKENHGSLDLNKFSEKQVDSVLETLKQNEEHTYQYHIKRLESESNIKRQVIDASVVDQKTYRYVILGGLAIVFITTMVILIFAREFFEKWLIFLTGILGGFGLGKATSSLNDTKQTLISASKNSDDSE